MEKIIKTIKGSNGKDILMDIMFDRDSVDKKIIVFSHGFKGFKDWGCFELISRKFAENSFVFVKFNFSHNGTTAADPLDFVDLDSFGNNNFSKELNDLGFVLDWIDHSSSFGTDIYLLGHSRGGGISMLKSGEDSRVKGIISWSSPCNFLDRMPKERIDIWKEKGVAFIYNGRTKQNMPMYIQFYEDCIENSDRLDIKKSISNLNIPHLIIHGSLDPTVDMKEAKELHKWNPNSDIFIIEGSDHVFGAIHPYHSDTLPLDLQKVVNKTIEFINQ